MGEEGSILLSSSFHRKKCKRKGINLERCVYREKWVRRKEKGTGLKNERAMTKERVRGMERKKRKGTDADHNLEQLFVSSYL